MNDSYYDNDCDYDNSVDWMTMCSEMANTIDALNTNIILLNKFIESAIDVYDGSMNFKENVEITSFDISGNIMTCVKSDGSGNYIPCVFMDLSSNMIQFGLPYDDNNENTIRERSFSPYSPYYYPYYSPYYSPYYNPYYNSYNPYSILLNNVNRYRDIPVENMMNANAANNDPMVHRQTNNPPYYNSHNRPPYYHPHYRPPYYPPHHRPPYYNSHYRPPYYRPHYRPPYYRPHHRQTQCHESMNE